ncbi:hypothetical protein TruAng_003045 [Truncatella angustata]|nr:hypothetical protein TruAng_003045 [Truncatella angustata]
MAAPADYQVNNANPPQIGLYTKVGITGKFQIEDTTIIFAWVTSVATHCLVQSPIMSVQQRVFSFQNIPDHCLGYVVYLRRLVDGFISQSPIYRGAIYVATAGIGVLTDVLMLALPISIVIGLKIPLRQEIILVGLFAVGSATLITFIVRLVILLQSLAKQDQAYALTKGTLWICIESNLPIMCCCLPTLRSFFRHVAPILIGEKRSTDGDASNQPGRYALNTFGSSPMNPNGQ